MQQPFNPWDYPLTPAADLRLLSPDFETYQEALAECLLRIGHLEGEGSKKARLLARRLHSCAAGDDRCLSPACPLCWGRMRLWLGEQQLLLWVSYDPLLFWTLIPAKFAVGPGQLNSISPRRLNNALRQQLSRTGISGPIVGGIDGEFDLSRGVYQPHHHLAGPADIKPEMETLGSQYYPQTPGVYRPTYSSEVRNRPDLFSYCFKSYWPERPRWQTNKGDKRRGRPQRLHKTRHVEWLLWRAQFSLTDFVFLAGVRRRGGRLVFT